MPFPLPALLQAYALGDSGPMQHVHGRVWRLPTSDGDIAIKCYAPEHHARALKEASVIAHLNDCLNTPCAYPFRVQKLIPTRSGELLWSGEQTHVMASRWEDGHLKTFDHFTLTEWEALGTSLAALHLALESLLLPGLETLHQRLHAINATAVHQNLLADESRILHLPESRQLQDYLQRCAQLLDTHLPGSLSQFPADDPQLPIHNDYNQFNYLFNGSQMPVILDWEACIGAPREYELVRCMNHLPLIAPEQARAFIHAYLEIHPLHRSRMCWAVDAACVQHALKRWILQHWLETPQAFNAQLQGAMSMTQLLVSARQPLIDFYTRLCPYD